MLLMRDVMVGFLGLSSASAAACTLLAPEWLTVGVGLAGATGLTACGRARSVSGWEWTDDAVEAETGGEPAGLAVVVGGFVVVGAAMVVPLCLV